MIYQKSSIYKAISSDKRLNILVDPYGIDFFMTKGLRTVVMLVILPMLSQST